MTITGAEIANVLDAVAWPLLVGITLFAMRKPLSRLITETGKRITKLSIGDFGIELSTMTEMSPKFANDFDIQQLAPTRVFDSASQSLFKQLATQQPADYALIDLGKGNKWLSSRLYIFSLILGRVNGIKSFVFIETRGDISRCFVGSSSPSDVCRSLAQFYPWLESAFIKAYSSIAPDPKTSNEPYELAALAESNSWQISNIVQKYIDELKQDIEPLPETKEQWISFGNPIKTWERTTWLKGYTIDEILGPDLVTSSVVEFSDAESQELAKVIIKRSGNFVALTDNKDRFKGLVDRSAFLEELAKTIK